MLSRPRQRPCRSTHQHDRPRDPPAPPGSTSRADALAPLGRLVLINGEVGVFTAVDGRPVSVMAFTVVDGRIAEINARVQSVQFYEASANPFDRKDRRYATRFPQTARHVVWELDLGGNKEFVELAKKLHKKKAIVSGKYHKKKGVEIPERHIVTVTALKAAGK